MSEFVSFVLACMCVLLFAAFTYLCLYRMSRGAFMSVVENLDVYVLESVCTWCECLRFMVGLIRDPTVVVVALGWCEQ